MPTQMWSWFGTDSKLGFGRCSQQGSTLSGDFSIRAVPHQPPHKLVFCQRPSGFNLKDAEEADSADNKRPPCMCPFPGHGVTWTGVRLSITRDGTIMDLKSCCHSKCSFSQPKTHTVLRHAPNGWKYGQLPCCPQALMIESPAEAQAVVQTHCSFRAHLVLNKNSHHSYQFKS